MNSKTQVLVKEEVEKMHKSGIIRVAKYNKWLSNIVLVRKKNGKIRVCVDYIDLNVATPKDVYPMPVADMLVDAVAGHELLSFMEGTAGYHQILVAEEDRHKTAFRCPGFAEVYIDDVVVKSKKRGDHIVDFRKVFERMRQHKLKMNPAKCIFGVQAGKIQPFSPLLKLQGQNEFLRLPLAAYLLKMTRNASNMPSFTSVGHLQIRKQGRIGKWVLALSEFSLQYVPQKAVKGQAIVDFLAHHPMLDVPTARELEIATANITRPDLARILEYALKFKCTNNQAEYEALIIGLEVLLELGVRDVQVRGDSLLVINQLQEKYRCVSCFLVPYLNRAVELLDQFDDVGLEYIPRECNFAANEVTQLATGITLKYGVRERILKVERRTLPSWLVRPDPPDDPVIAVLEPIEVDWRIPLIDYLKQPDPTADRKIRFLALNYFLRGDELRRRGEDGIDFRCVYGREAKRLMREVHEGVCGAHQAGPKMRWLIRRHGYYWPSILKDCIAFAKGCQDCQAHGPVQHISNIPMQPIIKPWPARGWALDLIGMIHPHSSLQHKFGIPEVLVSERGASFMGGDFEKLVNDYGIQFIHSTPYYTQSNGQAEASNKIIITLLKKLLVENPRQWHNTLYETLWAYHTSKRNPTASTPYALMFGHDAVLLLDINVQSLRVQDQQHLIGEDYVQAM
ncbi:uncharacterized protein LOC112170997 [Rosa chinensis]|uniref:uncharacterized protein LOC112170997 n=1 Tax=Rosa chinensis TaxID=74649 RepID=UPI000D096711|nr:uncharacterized protein LOC112170997 [Rosa chinensis]